MTAPLPGSLNSTAFPQGTPLHAFFAWNEARILRDRRYTVALDIHRLLERTGGGVDICLAHLTGQPMIARASGRRLLVSPARLRAAREYVEAAGRSAPALAARELLEALLVSIDVPDLAAHARVFQAFEALARHVDLAALARLRPSAKPHPPRTLEILIVKLGALGDFVQVLGPMPDIRRHHAADRITLLTTAPYAGLAAQTRLFDDIIIDRRPMPLDIGGWLSLARTLRRCRFDRVYDFQTSDRTAFYRWFVGFGTPPEWSGTAWRCSHPHANQGRDRQHTMDRQAEQLLMAGIYPAARVPWLPPGGPLPAEVAGKRFTMLIPGSSPRHPEKRWPARRYGELGNRLSRAGYLPVVVGVESEADLGRAIRAVCSQAVDLTGRTDIAGLSALARAAALTVGNDTGATHLAAAGGNPVIVLFSQASDPDLCAPRGKATRILIEPDLAELPAEIVFAASMTAVEPARG